MSDRPAALVFDPLSWRTDFSYDQETEVLRGHGVDLMVPGTPEERDGLLAGAVVLVSAGTEPITAQVIGSLHGYVGIVAAQAGLDHIDLEAAEAAGIPVVNVTASTEEVADHALALVLAATRRLGPLMAAAERRDWRSLELSERMEIRRLRGQVMGIIGPGRIGRAVAARARSFGFETIGAGRRPRATPHKGVITEDAAHGIEIVSFDTLLARSDVIVVCADANPSSVGLLDADAFARMKRGVVLVNVSRGVVIDEAALADALDSGIVGVAALDVRSQEPPDANVDRITGHPRVIQTPHVAGASQQARDDLHRLTAEGVLQLLDRAGRVEYSPGGADVDVAAIHHLDDFEEAARPRLAEGTYGYVAGGAGQERTVRRNRESLDRLLLVPRVMRDVRDVDASTSVLGGRLDFPLVVAPSAVQRIAHSDGELATARAARDAGVTMVLSMNSSTTMEDVAAEGVRFWMQLYVASDRDHMRGIVERAEAAGAAALCITVDHAGMPTRLRELRRPLVVPPHVRFVHLAEDPSLRGIDRTLTWEIVDWIRSISSLPIVLKGVLHPEDAAHAADRGVEAVIVSNHGGRQLDGTVSSYDVLEAVLEAVDGRSEVLVDGGIRSGTDLMKALALGARAGLIGRPIWWGLSAAGQAGVARVLELVRTDFEEAMRLCGVSSVDAIDRHLLWKPDH